MSRGQAVFEGDLNLDDDDASSSESERGSEGGYNEPPLEFSDHEEETLEVFTKVPTKPKVVEKPKPVEAPKLHEVVEQPAFETTAEDAIDITFDDNDAPDEFGITYKKNNKKKSAPPTIESEFVLETPIDINAALQAMKTSSSAAAAADDDDEFGFDTSEADTSASDAIRKALDSVANRETVEHSNEIHVDNSDFLIGAQSATAVSNGPILQPIDEPILANSKANSNSSSSVSGTTAKKSSALADARKAYQDVIEVYGGGMGDQEVLLLDSEETTTAGKPKKGPSVPLTAQIDKTVKGHVIEEGDEEEEEEEEQQEAVRQMEQVQATHQLKSEWDDLEDAASAPPAKSSSVSNPLAGGVASSSGLENLNTFSPVTYKAALELAQARGNLSSYNSVIVISEPQQSSSWFGLGKPSEISYPGYQISDLQLPFQIAQLDYDPAEHINMLRTIYHFVIKTKKGESGSAEISSTGGHWEKIGFQGVDPRTDLNRSMKLLSVIQMLEFMESDPTFFRQLHTLSGSADTVSSHIRSSKVDTSWPFMCVAIMFTKESIQALRSGVLNAKCSKYQSVMKALNTFHHSCFFEFYRLLTEQPSVHHAVHLAALRKQCSDSPLKIMNAYRAHLKKPASSIANQPKATSAGSSSAGGGSSAPSEELLTKFDNLESLDDNKSPAGDESSGWSNVFGGGGKASKFVVK